MGQVQANLQIRLRHTAKDNKLKPRLTTTDSLLTTQPTHLVHTYDGQVERLYINGKLNPVMVPGVGSFANWLASHPLNIGNEGDSTRPWFGTIYQAAVYNRALSDAEIQQNYAAGPQ
jgi:hypothetical protein